MLVITVGSGVLIKFKMKKMYSNERVQTAVCELSVLFGFTINRRLPGQIQIVMLLQPIWT